MDERWTRFVESHPKASIFHTSGWLKALRETYGYRPVAFVDAAPGREIQNGQVYCIVNSWVTGKRLVSVPFSDHTALLSGNAESEAILEFLKTLVDRDEYRYIEIRPLGSHTLQGTPLSVSARFMLHSIPLDTNLSEIYARFHKDCVQRKIRRAEREQLGYSEPPGDSGLETFYRLLQKSHRRHHSPVQPSAWFRNLIEFLGDRAKIRIATKNGLPVSAIMTLTFHGTMTFKYGGSDAHYHATGSVPFLLWRSIQEAHASGMSEFDMGRSDREHAGLIAFKQHWGAHAIESQYWRYPAGASMSVASWKYRVARTVLSVSPAIALRAAGWLFYRHVG